VQQIKAPGIMNAQLLYARKMRFAKNQDDPPPLRASPLGEQVNPHVFLHDPNSFGSYADIDRSVTRTDTSESTETDDQTYSVSENPHFNASGQPALPSVWVAAATDQWYTLLNLPGHAIILGTTIVSYNDRMANQMYRQSLVSVHVSR
jgi:hypothetical protein